MTHQLAFKDGRILARVWCRVLTRDEWRAMNRVHSREWGFYIADMDVPGMCSCSRRNVTWRELMWARAYNDCRFCIEPCFVWFLCVNACRLSSVNISLSFSIPTHPPSLFFSRKGLSQSYRHLDSRRKTLYSKGAMPGNVGRWSGDQMFENVWKWLLRLGKGRYHLQSIARFETSLFVFAIKASKAFHWRNIRLEFHLVGGLEHPHVYPLRTPTLSNMTGYQKYLFFLFVRDHSWLTENKWCIQLIESEISSNDIVCKFV